VFGEMRYFDLPPDAEETVEYVMETLTPIESRMLLMSYRDGKTYKSIGKECGYPKERIRHIITKAMRKLRHQSRSEILSIGRQAFLSFIVTAEKEEKIRYYQHISELEAMIHNQLDIMNLHQNSAS